MEGNPMPKLVVRSFAISLDGFSAAPGQSQEAPDAKDKEAGRGGWGENPPYHHPVFVLSHQKKASFDMEGGTRFSFVTEGIESALKQAFAAAKGKDVRLAGGPATVRQYLKAGLID